ncbi:MAG: hypothetical protein ABF969_11985 [Sporolactobacillus sp.]
MNYQIKEIDCPVPYCKAYKFGRCNVLVGQEPNVGWHLSISHHRVNPTWGEIRDARYQFVPDGVQMAMFLPPKKEYVNIHEHCFHLFETKEREKI